MPMRTPEMASFSATSLSRRCLASFAGVLCSNIHGMLRMCHMNMCVEPCMCCSKHDVKLQRCIFCLLKPGSTLVLCTADVHCVWPHIEACVLASLKAGYAASAFFIAASCMMQVHVSKVVGWKSLCSRCLQQRCGNPAAHDWPTHLSVHCFSIPGILAFLCFWLAQVQAIVLAKQLQAHASCVSAAI